MTEILDLDLAAIGKLYYYTPPKPEPTQSLKVDWTGIEGIKGGLREIFTQMPPEGWFGAPRPWSIRDEDFDLVRIPVSKTIPPR